MRISEWRTKVESIPIEGCTLKAECLAARAAEFPCAPRHLRAASFRPDQHTADEGGMASRATQRRAPGDCPSISGPNSTSRASTIARLRPPGTHTMSMFSQYVPYQFAEGDWDDASGMLLSDSRLHALGALLLATFPKP